MWHALFSYFEYPLVGVVSHVYQFPKDFIIFLMQTSSVVSAHVFALHCILKPDLRFSRFTLRFIHLIDEHRLYFLRLQPSAICPEIEREARRI